jgi:hypothetical protein
VVAGGVVVTGVVGVVGVVGTVGACVPGTVPVVTGGFVAIAALPAAAVEEPITGALAPVPAANPVAGALLSAPPQAAIKSRGAMTRRYV